MTTLSENLSVLVMLNIILYILNNSRLIPVENEFQLYVQHNKLVEKCLNMFR